MIYRCKVCGGALNIDENKTVCTCEYCGNTQTYPKINSERINQLLSRADTYRRENKYDSAINLYNQILDEEKEDPEVYWLIVLSQFGIEYIDDIRTHKKVPTVNRTSRFSIFSNENYKKAIELADDYQRKEYEKEASRINEIQKQILEISSQEEPYDVFICYKETDNLNNRTEDSVIAYDVYQRLSKLGYKVFYSKISLSDKTGNSFEPYIYSALNTSRIMLLISTSVDSILSPWVRNEWSRFLSLMKEDPNKYLIPCYKYIKPSDLPDDISYLQGLNMSGLGWEQDLEIAVEKLLKKRKESNAVNNLDNVGRLMDRALIYLRNNEYEEAYRQYDRILDFDIKNEDAYLGKLFSEYKTHSIEELGSINSSLLGSKNYQWLINNGSDKIRQTLISLSEQIDNRIYKQQKEAKNTRIKKTGLLFVTGLLLCVLTFFGLKFLNMNKQANDVQKSVIGDVVTFGSYEQDNSSINGKEKIEWIVLDKSDNSIMLISRYVLDCQSYSTENSYVSYDDSFIKQWLNNAFFEQAFNSNEKNYISEIRLLSTDEAKELFNDVSARTGVATEYSISKGLQVSSTYGNCEYWLAPSNELSHYAAKVNANGSVNSKVDNVNVGNGVRPVIIIKK